MVTVRSGQTRTVPVGDATVRLRTARGAVYELTAGAVAAIEQRDGESDVGPESSTRPTPGDRPEPRRDETAAPNGTGADTAVVMRSAQRSMLERLDTARDIHGRHRNLLVAAPGTGKTAIAAFDYKRLRQKHKRDLRLLFVANRTEALHQSRRTYQAVLRDADFGETAHGGAAPRHWNHVFTTVQALVSRYLDQLAPDHFDVIVIDEFHQATSLMYRRALHHFRPLELIGLTATPERADGKSIQDEFFDGRIAAEMRLWEALENGMLCPFHYFGTTDSTDLRAVEWKRGAYDIASLSSVLSGNEARARLVVKAVRERVANPSSMRGLGFCVSVAHADFMAQFFRNAGFKAMALTAMMPADQRQQVRSSFKAGELQVIFSVGHFDEGVGIPEVDTLLMLRPAHSTTDFLQQLGVGLRPAPGKAVLTVLDFIGTHRREYRCENQFRALTNLTHRRLVDHIEHDFPQLPTGCQIVLEETAKRIVIENIKGHVEGNSTEMSRELAQYGEPKLGRYLEESGRELDELYRGKGISWTGLLRRAGLLEGDAPEGEAELLRRVPAFLHVDDPKRVRAYTRMLEDDPPLYRELDEQDQAYARMLFFQLWPLGGPARESFTGYQEGFTELRRQHAVRSELRQVLAHNLAHTEHAPISLLGLGGEHDVPLTIHAYYSREEILAALGQAEIGGLLPADFREGVKWCESVKTDALFITLEKDEKGFSPQTRRHDYALGETLFRWESQNQTSETSSRGLRYQNHVEMGTNVLLFVRRYKSTDIGSAQPWMLLGPAEYVEHTGSKPMAIIWRLRHRLPADVWSYASIIR
ncbi:DUF3427 domain-containing protein [Streptomyces sp. NPDC049744]|uniref:DUF3427 domain-containing protein n=1 Tax=Streptomyces sp. NPDC049744 TaxID=3154359 RepID=UPI0034493CC2